MNDNIILTTDNVQDWPAIVLSRLKIDNTLHITIDLSEYKSQSWHILSGIKFIQTLVENKKYTQSNMA